MNARKIGNKFLRDFADEFETNTRIWFVLFGLFYLMLVLLHSFRPFWYDELITYNVSRLPGMGAIWQALKNGADLNPPLFHWVTRVAVLIFGATEFGLRVPAIVGFFVLCTCLYVFVARRAGPGYGFVAMLIPMATGALQYASEARAYGLMLGFCGLALVNWQRAAERTPRVGALVGLALTLTAALLTHCYAVLVLAPFAMAEVARDYRRRKIDWAMWIALILPLNACLTYLPLMAAVHPYTVDNPIFRPTWHSLIWFYNFLLDPAVIPLLGASLVVAFFAARRQPEEAAYKFLWTPEEVVLASGFLLVPLLAILVAAFVTHIFMMRYGLSAVIGVAILFTQLAASLTEGSQRAGAALTLLLVGWPAAATVVWIATINSARPEPALSLDQRPDLPLVISSGLIFYQKNHYADAPLAARMYFLTDEQNALRATGTDVFDKGFPELNVVFPLRAKLEDYHRFMAAHPHFLVYGYASYETDWLLPELLRDGAQLNFLGQQTEQFGRTVLYEVTVPAGALPHK